jgi:type III secretion protein Q
MTASTTPTALESRIVPLAMSEGLPRLQAQTASVSQVVCDERFQGWLASALQVAQVRGRLRGQLSRQVVLSIETEQGGLRLGIDESALSRAAACALGLADRGLASEVVSEVLQPTFEAFAPVVTRVRVAGVEREDVGPSDMVVEVAGVCVTVCSASAALLAHVVRLMHGTSAVLDDLRGLRVPGRLRLAVRRWRQDFVESLRTGDTVLIGPSTLRTQWIVGTGVTMRGEAEMSFDTGQVEMQTPYRVVPEDPGGDGGPGEATLQDLQLPVAFELDTARISLAELAGMQPGYVVELDVPLSDASVRLVCHGQVVGQGQLVMVGDRLGVRIERMGGAHGIATDR